MSRLVVDPGDPYELLSRLLQEANRHVQEADLEDDLGEFGELDAYIRRLDDEAVTAAATWLDHAVRLHKIRAAGAVPRDADSPDRANQPRASFGGAPRNPTRTRFDDARGGAGRPDDGGVPSPHVEGPSRG